MSVYELYKALFVHPSDITGRERCLYKFHTHAYNTILFKTKPTTLPTSMFIVLILQKIYNPSLIQG